MFLLSEDRIDREKVTADLKEDQAGALVVFEGWVRNHNQGKSVNSLEYQVYAELAEKEGKKILDESREKFNLHRAIAVHRFGHLVLGDTAVFVGTIASHRDDAFRATRFIIDEIKLRLPIWKKEHYTNQAPEWVYCRDHTTHVHFEEKDYYEKQARLIDSACLSRAKVLVVGAGGLGCPALMALATAGVGEITVADFDHVSLSNLHRQTLFTTEDVGEKKATVARTRLSLMNPFIRVHSKLKRVEADNVASLVSGQDLVLDCTDNFESKMILHDACFLAGVPLISASVYRFQGNIRTFLPSEEHGCLRCVFSATPDDSLIGNCNDFGVLGATVSTIGSIQASEALEFLANQTNSTIRDTFYLDLKTLSPMKLRNLKRADCEGCGSRPDLGKKNGTDSITDAHRPSEYEISIDEVKSSDFRLVDIRREDDAVLDRLRESLAADESESEGALPSPKWVVYCHRGIRSKKLVQAQRAKGFFHFYSLKGGACSL
ncbi:MAG: ThiF family adenylyltransferase [Cryobacterium sp.]|nr:ThiF family adenylyltransferase [Oligoflexia bacterium]